MTVNLFRHSAPGDRTCGVLLIGYIVEYITRKDFASVVSSLLPDGPTCALVSLKLGCAERKANQFGERRRSQLWRRARGTEPVRYRIGAGHQHAARV